LGGLEKKPKEVNVKIGIPKEIVEGEIRVALVPSHIKELLIKDHEVHLATDPYFPSPRLENLNAHIKLQAIC
jgi:hypothetical protein